MEVIGGNSGVAGVGSVGFLLGMLSPFRLDSRGEELLLVVMAQTILGKLVWRIVLDSSDDRGMKYVAEYKRYGLVLHECIGESQDLSSYILVTRLLQGWGKVDPDVQEVLLYVLGKEIQEVSGYVKMWGELRAAVQVSAEKSRVSGIQELLRHLRPPVSGTGM